MTTFFENLVCLLLLVVFSFANKVPFSIAVLCRLLSRVLRAAPLLSTAIPGLLAVRGSRGISEAETERGEELGDGGRALSSVYAGHGERNIFGNILLHRHSTCKVDRNGCD